MISHEIVGAGNRDFLAIATCGRERKSKMARTEKTCAEVLADFVHETDYDDLPKEAVTMARQMVLDQLGGQLASSTLDWNKEVFQYVKDLAIGSDQATVVNYGFGATTVIPQEQASKIAAAVRNLEGIEDLPDLTNLRAPDVAWRHEGDRARTSGCRRQCVSRTQWRPGRSLRARSGRLLCADGYRAATSAADLPEVPFFPRYWAFGFPTATVAGLALRWLALEHPAGERLYAAIVTAAITAFIGAIALGSLIALARRLSAVSS